MENMIAGMLENPILIVLFMIGITGFFLSIRPMLKALKIGKVACNKCGHVGNLKQTMTNQLVCSDCGSADWKLVAQPTFDSNAHVFCSECGTQCPDNTAFCNKCGNKLSGA